MNDYQKIIKNAIDHVAKGGKFVLKHRCNGRRMSDKYFLNEDKTYRPCSLMEWGTQHETMDKHVAQDEINDCWIATVWLGLDLNHWGGPPLVFETMVFKEESDIYCDRYTTWTEAEDGHQKAIEWVKNGCKEDER